MRLRVPFRVVIPARWASTRLPGKPLADIAGKPMVVRVAEAAVKSGAMEICIATDDGGPVWPRRTTISGIEGQELPRLLRFSFAHGRN